jgi:hypothetical protein
VGVALPRLSERHFAVGALFFFAFWLLVVLPFLYTVPRYSHDEAPNKRPADESENHGFWQKAGDDPVAYFTLWLVGFTGVLAVSTIGLWIVTWRASASQARDMKASIAAAERSAGIARDAMIAGERAFVFTVGLAPFWELDPTTNLYNWRFRPTWKNSGDTPTRRMIMHSECALRTTPLPEGFDFSYPTAYVGTALIPPNTETHGGIAPRSPAPAITPQDILDIQAGRKFLYYWGWAKYFDVFPDTPQHITRFCWQVLLSAILMPTIQRSFPKTSFFRPSTISKEIAPTMNACNAAKTAFTFRPWWLCAIMPASCRTTFQHHRTQRKLRTVMLPPDIPDPLTDHIAEMIA